MGEHAIRDLNDDINKLIREKWHWNKRIIELGGPDYNKIEIRQRREEGDIYMDADDDNDVMEESVRGSGGYRYFGAAKELPGVKELFVRHATKVAKRKRGDVYKNINSDYFGLRDEDDGIVLRLEANEAQRRINRLEKQRNDFQEKAKNSENVTLDDLLSWDHLSDDEDDNGLLEIGGISGEADAIAAHFNVPTKEIVEEALLEKRKKDLLAQLGIA